MCRISLLASDAGIGTGAPEGSRKARQGHDSAVRINTFEVGVGAAGGFSEGRAEGADVEEVCDATVEDGCLHVRGLICQRLECVTRFVYASGLYVFGAYI
eukprot:1019515-Rhodomonas_salina.1